MIFIGSSLESLPLAQEIADRLKGSDFPHDVVLWSSAFRPGELSLETIDRLLSSVSGAIFLAFPDDETIYRGKSVYVPRQNVLLEMAMFAARIGRERVLWVEFDGVDLPTDLLGLTTCRVQKTSPSSSSRDLSSYEIDPLTTAVLQNWARDLPFLPNGSRVTTVVHGYSGKWYSFVRFSKWRGHRIVGSSYAFASGELILDIPISGVGGRGAIYGTLDVQLKLGGVLASTKFRLVDKISDAQCRPDGTLVLVTETFTRQRVSISDESIEAEGFMQELPGPNQFAWVLVPEGSGILCGNYSTPGGKSIGQVHLSRSEAAVLPIHIKSGKT